MKRASEKEERRRLGRRGETNVSTSRAKEVGNRSRSWRSSSLSGVGWAQEEESMSSEEKSAITYVPRASPFSPSEEEEVEEEEEEEEDEEDEHLEDTDVSHSGLRSISLIDRTPRYTPIKGKGKSKGKGKGGKYKGGKDKKKNGETEGVVKGGLKGHHANRVENLRRYSEAKLIWDKMTNPESSHDGSKWNPREGVGDEVVKMVKRGNAYMANFVKFDGHRQAMAVWRTQTKMEKKQKTCDAPTSICGEYARTLKEYRTRLRNLHVVSGKSRSKAKVYAKHDNRAVCGFKLRRDVPKSSQPGSSNAPKRDAPQLPQGRSRNGSRSDEPKLPEKAIKRRNTPRRTLSFVRNVSRGRASSLPKRAIASKVSREPSAARKSGRDHKRSRETPRSSGYQIRYRSSSANSSNTTERARSRAQRESRTRR